MPLKDRICLKPREAQSRGDLVMRDLPLPVQLDEERLLGRPANIPGLPAKGIFDLARQLKAYSHEFSRTIG